MHAGAILALAALASVAWAQAALAGDDDAVVVIRGSTVSIARPLTPERVRDGSGEVEIVRVESAPAPPPRRAEPEREIVVVVLPAAQPAPPPGVALAWGGAWPWPVDPRWPHAVPRRHGHFLPGLHLGSSRAPMRSGLRSR
jgi:hypothetical protein